MISGTLFSCFSLEKKQTECNMTIHWSGISRGASWGKFLLYRHLDDGESEKPRSCIYPRRYLLHADLGGLGRGYRPSNSAWWYHIPWMVTMEAIWYLSTNAMTLSSSMETLKARRKAMGNELIQDGEYGARLVYQLDECPWSFYAWPCVRLFGFILPRLWRDFQWLDIQHNQSRNLDDMTNGIDICGENIWVHDVEVSNGDRSVWLLRGPSKNLLIESIYWNISGGTEMGLSGLIPIFRCHLPSAYTRTRPISAMSKLTAGMEPSRESPGILSSFLVAYLFLPSMRYWDRIVAALASRSATRIPQ